MLSRPIIGRFPILPTARQNNMDCLPEELVIRILHFLDIKDLVHIQLVSSRYLSLARDDTIWKEECFTHSRSEARRRRQHQLDIQDARLAELRYALTALPGSADVNAPRTSTEPAFEAKTQRHRALANWDPGYPDEKLNFYEEYISRHAPIQIGWLDLPKPQQDESREATGIGILQTSTDQRHAIAPLDDGSICIYDISARSTHQSGGGGKLIAQSQAGLLSGRPATATAESHTIMTETGAVECVSIDSSSNKGYFGVGSQLHQIDLNTLQISSTKEYPWPITALSECSAKTPVTVGTNHTIHLYDPRDPSFSASQTSGGGELIGGSIYSHATLTQPGPLSILNGKGVEGERESIWVAGRFTSLLNYDRRFFPRLLGTVFSGGRIASLSQTPHAFVPRNLDLLRNPAVSVSTFHEAKSRAGSTILAAAEYKGKGSLEIYNIPTSSGSGDETYYRNRQTASASKLLSVAPHGGKIVFSDGDGNLRWFEQDASSHIRTFNIQDSSAPRDPSRDSGGGIWQSTGSELPGQGDIVQKILPLPSCPFAADIAGRADIGDENLLLWSGDGRIGVLGFGHGCPLGGEDAVEQQGQGVGTAQRAREDAERQYGMAMRRALQRNADEVRFVRGLGMGYG